MASGDTGWTIKLRSDVLKTSHLHPERGATGFVDKQYFTPETKDMLRCYTCNKVFDNSFCDVGRCPHCSKAYTRGEFEAMFIEAVYTRMNHGNWTAEVLQLLSKTKEPSMLRPDGRITSLTEGARRIVSFYVAELRKKNKEMAMPAEMYKLRANAFAKELSEPVQPRRL